jgi:hypothetical protein
LDKSAESVVDRCDRYRALFAGKELLGVEDERAEKK